MTTMVAEILAKLPSALDTEIAQGHTCVLQFNLSSPIHIQIEDERCSVHPGAAAQPDLDITISDENFVKLMQGELNGVMALMSGKLQIDGDLGLAKQMLDFFDAEKLK
jgi:putative sterol carrier protein